MGIHTPTYKIKIETGLLYWIKGCAEKFSAWSALSKLQSKDGIDAHQERTEGSDERSWGTPPETNIFAPENGWLGDYVVTGSAIWSYP